MKVDGNNVVKFDVSNVATGVYIVEVVAANKHKVEKITISH